MCKIPTHAHKFHHQIIDVLIKAINLVNAYFTQNSKIKPFTYNPQV